MKKSLLKSSVFVAAAAAMLSFAAPASAQAVSACLITKTDTNPFFVKMKEGATAKAQELGITLKAYAGKVDGDSVIDGAMAAYGGTVLRRPVDDVEAEVAAIEQAERKAAREARRELLQARREHDRDAVQAKVEQLKAKLAHQRDETPTAAA